MYRGVHSLDKRYALEDAGDDRVIQKIFCYYNSPDFDLTNIFILPKECHKQMSESAMNAKELVMEYFETCDRKDFKSARSYVSDDVSYVSPIGSFDKAEPYFKYFEHVDLPKMDIRKVFVDGPDVCVLHELNFGAPPVPMLVCTWCHVKSGKIDSIKVVFDPRPWVQEQRM